MMKTYPKTGVMLSCIFLCMLTAAAPAPVHAALFNDIIVLSAGAQAERSFHIYKPFSAQDLSGMNTYLVVAAAAAGALSLEFSIAPDIDFGEKVYYSLTGAAYSPDEGVSPVYAKAETPFSAFAEIPVSGGIGIVLVGAMITAVEGRMEWPIKGCVIFSAVDEETDHHDDDDDHDDDHVH